MRPDRRGVKPDFACARLVARLHLYADVLESSPVGSGVNSRPVGLSFKCARLVAQLCFACLCV